MTVALTVTFSGLCLRSLHFPFSKHKSAAFPTVMAFNS